MSNRRRYLSLWSACAQWRGLGVTWSLRDNCKFLLVWPERTKSESPDSIRGYKRDVAMGRNKRRHPNARSDVLSGGVQKWGLRQVDRKLSIRVDMTVKQWRQ